MLIDWRNHKTYQAWLQDKVIELYSHYHAAFKHYDDLLSKLWTLDLDPAFDVLSPYYRLFGRLAERQAEVLRAFVAVLHCRCDSISIWVKRLKSEPVLAVACGFEPNQVPGISTFYDFLDRLQL